MVEEGHTIKLNMSLSTDSFFDFISWIKYAIYAVFSYFAIETETFMLLMLLMGIDTLFGSILALKRKWFRIRALNWGIIIKVLMLLIPFAFAATAKILGKNYDILPDLFVGLLAAGEFISILSNFYMIKTGETIKHIDIVSWGILKIKLQFQNGIARLYRLSTKDDDEAED